MLLGRLAFAELFHVQVDGLDEHFRQLETSELHDGFDAPEWQFFAILPFSAV